ncbi:type VII secretion integral membrane protein EccD [Rhodococcoides kroppenstedtii]|uniref:type VII secretion integral membrane protein EccD n=1 Tax=Rhodococcoides kroppenstedtii TaxID=293050 RepID=UPI0021BE0BAF|nr:type VII secretion integral membrane protein EccD [Rhodococcus kroppenstedtii]
MSGEHGTEAIARVPGAAAVQHHSVRATVVGLGVEADVSMPAGLAVAAVIPAVLDIVRPTGSPPDEGPSRHVLGAPAAHELWTLSGRRLDRSSSLSDNGIRDGDVLVLRRADTISAPVVDDVAAAVSAPLRADRGPQPAAVAGPIGAVLAAAAASVVAVGDGAASIALGVAIAVLTTIAAHVCATVTRDAGLICCARGSACLLAFGAGAAVVPGRDLGADAVLGFAAVVTVCVLTAVAAGPVGRATFTTITTVAVIGTVVGAVVAFTSFPAASVAAVTALVCTVAVTRAPRLAATRAGIRIPPVPLGDAAGPVGSSGRVVHRHTPATRAAAAATVDTDIDLVAARAGAARAYLTGYVTALSVAATTAAVITATTDLGRDIDAARMTFAALVGAVFCAQSRGHGDRTRAAVTAVCGACVVPAVCVVGVILRPELALVWLGATAPVAAALVLCGLVAPRRRFSPPVRRAADWAEYAATGALVPLTVWIVGALSAVRGL